MDPAAIPAVMKGRRSFMSLALLTSHAEQAAAGAIQPAVVVTRFAQKGLAHPGVRKDEEALVVHPLDNSTGHILGHQDIAQAQVRRGGPFVVEWSAHHAGVDG